MKFAKVKDEMKTKLYRYEIKSAKKIDVKNQNSKFTFLCSMKKIKVTFFSAMIEINDILFLACHLPLEFT